MTRNFSDVLLRARKALEFLRNQDPLQTWAGHLSGNPPAISDPSSFAPENLITLPHFSVSSATTCQNRRPNSQARCRQDRQPRLQLGIGEARIDLGSEVNRYMTNLH